MKLFRMPNPGPFPVLFALCLVPPALVVLFAILLNSPFDGTGGEERILEIPEGASASRVIRFLRDEGVIRFSWPARVYLAMTLEANRIHAGEYRFRPPETTAVVIRRLLEGDVYLHQVTIPEGARLQEVVDAFVEAGIVERDRLEKAVAAPEWIRELDPDADDLEGYLFPDTYRFPRGTAAPEIVSAMIRRFREVWDSVRAASCVDGEVAVRDTVAMASLIEKETGQEEERPIISSVFHNRLRLGMPLQCDPTVIYGLLREGRFSGRLTRADLETPTPYNTYTRRGLPPGPIANPGEESLRAALCPGDSDYIYFVSMNTGRHFFSRTLKEHQEAVRKYQQ
jgi:UPF0755 protein